MENAVELRNITFSYNKENTIIDNFSLNLKNGEITAIIGRNGSGKTTLGKLVMGIVKPLSGSIAIFNKNALEMTLGQRGKDIGYLFQNPEKQLFAATVYEELSFVLELKGYETNEIQKKVLEMLDLFQLDHLRDRFPFFLSGGEKQRLALASALIHEPRYLILDEPTTSLDTKRRDLLFDIVKRLKSKGIGMMVISHDESFVEAYTDRIVEIEGGRIKNDSKFNF